MGAPTPSSLAEYLQPNQAMISLEKLLNSVKRNYQARTEWKNILNVQSILLNAYCVLDTILGSFTTLPYLILTKAQWEENYYLHMVQECAEFLSFTSNPLTPQASVALNMSD